LTPGTVNSSNPKKTIGRGTWKKRRSQVTVGTGKRGWTRHGIFKGTRLEKDGRKKDTQDCEKRSAWGTKLWDVLWDGTSSGHQGGVSEALGVNEKPGV